MLERDTFLTQNPEGLEGPGGGKRKERRGTMRDITFELSNITATNTKKPGDLHLPASKYYCVINNGVPQKGQHLSRRSRNCAILMRRVAIE